VQALIACFFSENEANVRATIPSAGSRLGVRSALDVLSAVLDDIWVSATSRRLCDKGKQRVRGAASVNTHAQPKASPRLDGGTPATCDG
jgi:hypothetical protein